MPNRPHHSEKMRSCVEQLIAKGHDESSAYAICTASLQKAGEPIFEAAEEFPMDELRQLHLRNALGTVKTEYWNGREHLVVPCVALQEGVIHAVNAETPEFVPAASLYKSYDKWNGHPLVVGHPVKEGKQISAHDPAVLAQHGFGFIRQGHMNGSRLGIEALVDPARLEALNQQQLLKDLREGKPVEVSVGAFVTTNSKSGEHNGKPYKAEWVEIHPDHLAFLPNGRGACSMAMGCGAHRAASYLVTAETFVEEKPSWRIKDRLKALIDSLTGTPTVDALLAAAAKMKECEACKGTGSKDGNPCEACDGNGEYRTAIGARHSATDLQRIQTVHDHAVELGASCGTISIHDNTINALASKTEEDAEKLAAEKEDAEERTSEAVPANALPEAPVEEMPVDKTPDIPINALEEKIEDIDQILINRAAAGEAAFRAACRCQEDSVMTTEQKTAIISALVADKYSGFTAGDEKLLETATDERLESFRVAAESRASEAQNLKAAAERKMTPEEFMEVAPPELKSLINRQQKQETELKATLVTQLKAAQSEFSEAELSVMSVAELSRMANVAKVPVKIDYSGRGMPRILATKDDDEDYTPPDPYEREIKILQAKSAIN